MDADEAEQTVLLDTSAARIQAVIDSNDKLSPDRGVTRRLQRSLVTPDVPRMKLYDEQFRDHKQELTNIDVKLFSLDTVTQHTRALFNYS